MEFLGQLICLSPAVISLSTQLTRAALPWLRVTGVAQSALTLLATILRQAKATNNDQYKTVSSCIRNHLEVRIAITKLVHEVPIRLVWRWAADSLKIVFLKRSLT